MALEHSLYVATLRAVFRAVDDVEAVFIADQIKVNGEKDLEPEDGDSLEVMQVTQNLAQLSPEETLVLLRRARNALIRTRVLMFFDSARELDKCIYVLEARSESAKGLEMSGYDYGRFTDVYEKVLAGENPID